MERIRETLDLLQLISRTANRQARSHIPPGPALRRGTLRKQGSGGAVRNVRGELSALVRQQHIKLAVKQSGPPKKDIGHVRGITGREVLR